MHQNIFYNKTIILFFFLKDFLWWVITMVYTLAYTYSHISEMLKK